ncbi:MAG: site-specific integrase [Isosphaeraceae bacterium]|nr:site-specific integrase [Isosphaeraceae bacterium]
MASLEKRNQTYRIVFMYGGKRHGFSLGTGDRREAESLAGGVEKVLMRLEQKLLKLPPGVDIVAFVQNDGRIEEPEAPPAADPVTFAQFRDRYLATHEGGAMENNSLVTVRIHLSHLAKTLGERFPMASLTAADLQRHIARRSAMKGARGRRLSPATIRKELASFRAAWNWATHMGIVAGSFPNRGLVFPKTDEKPPFMTWQEIERRIQVGGLSDAQIAELWDALFLTLPEIEDLLTLVQSTARQPWIYPMILFAAHTGARRSEMIRAQIADVDFEGGTILIREKKRSRGQRTTRRVPLSYRLARVLKDWIEHHPGGQCLFGQAETVVHSKTKRAGSSPLTRDEAHDHFKRTLAGSKWKVIRGWHVLRHSFASNCAARGVDQRLIDSWLGHTTEIRKRYLHLIPSNESTALRSVFGEE